MFTCPPAESKVKFPDDVSTVFALVPTLTLLAIKLPVLNENTLVDGLYVSVASDDNATPAFDAGDDNNGEKVT